MNEQAKSPIKEFRAGTIRAAIWRNEVVDQGRTVVQHSVRIDKRFFDKKAQEWRESDYFFPNDLPLLCLVAQRAFEFVVLDESDHE